MRLGDRVRASVSVSVRVGVSVSVRVMVSCHKLGIGLGLALGLGQGVAHPVVWSDSSLSEMRAPPTGQRGSSGVRSTSS